MDATEETKEICDEVSFSLPSFFTTSTHNSLVCILAWIFYSIHTQVRGQVEKKVGVKYKEFTAVEYRIQVVEGENFLIKVNNIVIFGKNVESLRCVFV